MLIKGIKDEDFVNYKVPSMTLMFPYCTFKCGNDLCQNSELAKQEIIQIGIDDLCKRYVNNPISESVVCQGLEPFDSTDELLSFISKLRGVYDNHDDIVIYTGYNPSEVGEQLLSLLEYDNIIIKFGRFVPNQKPHHDDVLGVNLASDNQVAIRLTNKKENYGRNS